MITSPQIREFEKFWSQFKAGDVLFINGVGMIYQGFDYLPGGEEQAPFFTMANGVMFALISYAYSDIRPYINPGKAQ